MKAGRCMRWLEYVHATLLFALPVPVVCAVAGLADPAGTAVLFIRCLLPAVPIVITDIAARKVQSLISYLAVCAALLAGVYGAVFWLPGILRPQEGLGAYRLCCGIGMLIETCIICVLRLTDRISASEHRRAEDPLAPRQRGFLSDPAAALVWYLIACYLIGQCFGSRALCDIAFYCTAAYILLTLFYRYLRATDTYLKSNHRVSGLPGKRVRRISAAMLLAYAALLGAVMLPAAFLGGKRPYADIREWLRSMEMSPPVQENAMSFRAAGSLGGVDMLELLEPYRQEREPPVIVHILLGILLAVCILVFVYGVFLAVRQMVKDFRARPDENGDVIEELEDAEGTGSIRKLSGRRRQHGSAESEAMRIRRQYKKTIRAHRKERPAPHESPSEIEENAGLRGDAQMELLHRQYEDVRYSRRQHRDT